MNHKAITLFRQNEDMNNGQLFLPYMPRSFVWEEEQMLKLFDSLMRNHPIQTLLFWRTQDEIRARKFMGQMLSAAWRPAERARVATWSAALWRA